MVNYTAVTFDTVHCVKHDQPLEENYLREIKGKWRRISDRLCLVAGKELSLAVKISRLCPLMLVVSVC